MTVRFPSLRSVVLDTTDARALAEFYRQLLGYTYRPGDEPPGPGESDPNGTDWLVLVAPDGRGRLAFQQVDRLPQATWPDPTVPQQVHLDLAVPSNEALAAQHHRVLSLGARLLHDRFDDPDEPLYVYADPSGHPFCVFVAADKHS
jgi:catechol 2,3-dioxygenase-like lactoylglutathione lyase family enzyme